jgi:hypothetical protein
MPLMVGQKKNRRASPLRTPAIGRVKKMKGDPRDMTRLWRMAFSAISPRTNASTMGAIG